MCPNFLHGCTVNLDVQQPIFEPQKSPCFGFLWNSETSHQSWEGNMSLKRPKVEKFTRMRVAANQLQGNAETYQLDIASNQQELFYIYVMAYRVLSKSTYHSVWCASLPMAAPCALFSRWTSRTLEGQKWCFETLTVAIIDSPTSRQSCQRRTLSLLVWSQNFGHQIWEEWRIWGEDVGRRHRIISYITNFNMKTPRKLQVQVMSQIVSVPFIQDHHFSMSTTQPFSNFYGSTLYWASNYHYWPDRCWSKNGEQGEFPVGLWALAFPPSPSSAPSGKASSTAVLGTHAVRLRRKVRIRSTVPLPRLCSKASEMQCLGKGRPWCEDEGV